MRRVVAALAAANEMTTSKAAFEPWYRTTAGTNRAYVLDLVPGRSMLRWLAGQGLRPLLMDWGVPGPGEARFDLDDYGNDVALFRAPVPADADIAPETFWLCPPCHLALLGPTRPRVTEPLST